MEAKPSISLDAEMELEFLETIRQSGKVSEIYTAWDHVFNSSLLQACQESAASAYLQLSSSSVQPPSLDSYLAYQSLITIIILAGLQNAELETKRLVSDLLFSVDHRLIVLGCQTQYHHHIFVLFKLLESVERVYRNLLTQHYTILQPVKLADLHPPKRIGEDWPIPAKCSLTFTEFEHMLKEVEMTGGTPIVLLSEMQDWPALDRWPNFEYITQICGHRTVPVEIGRDYRNSDWKQTFMSMTEYLHTFVLNNDPPEIAYIAQFNLLRHVPILEKDIIVPDYCYTHGQGNCEINLWIGMCGTHTPLHYDRYHNLFGQVVGFKLIRMYHPQYQSELYPYSDTSVKPKNQTKSMNVSSTPTPQMAKYEATEKLKAEQLLSNTSQVKFDQLEAFPGVEKLPFYEFIIGPGQMIYIPPGWWHQVEALSFSISTTDAKCEHSVVIPALTLTFYTIDWMIEVSHFDFLPATPPPTIEDLSNILQERFNHDSFCTLASNRDLIVINPVELAHHQNSEYSEEASQHYWNNGDRACLVYPHIYGIASMAFKRLVWLGTDQHIIASGLSGSGKTESIQLMLYHLSCGADQSMKKISLFNKAMSIIQAFGSAYSVQNPQASQYSISIRLGFTLSRVFLGGSMELDQFDCSRLTNVGMGERNFSVFYYLISNGEPNSTLFSAFPAPAETIKSNEYLHLSKNYRKYRILSPHKSARGILDYDVARAKMLWSTFKFFEWSNKSIKTICHILAAILHLGNVTFDLPLSRNDPICVTDLVGVKRIARLLEIDPEDLRECLVVDEQDMMMDLETRNLKDACRLTRDATILTIHLDIDAATKRLDRLLGAMYQCLVEWILARLNKQLMNNRHEWKKPPDAFLTLSTTANNSWTSPTDISNLLERIFKTSRNPLIQQIFCPLSFTLPTEVKTTPWHHNDPNRISNADKWTITCLCPNLTLEPRLLDLDHLKVQVASMLAPLIRAHWGAYFGQEKLELFLRRYNFPRSENILAAVPEFLKNDIMIEPNFVRFGRRCLVWLEEERGEALTPQYSSKNNADNVWNAEMFGTPRNYSDFILESLPNCGSQDPYFSSTTESEYHEYIEKEVERQLTKPSAKEQKTKKSFSRCIWVIFSRLVTILVPDFALEKIGQMALPEMRQAWREKCALCSIIGCLSGAMLFFVIGFTQLICPHQMVITMEEVSKKGRPWVMDKESKLPRMISKNLISKANSNDRVDSLYFVVHGHAFRVDEVAKLHTHKTAIPDHIYRLAAGRDVSSYFPPPSSLAKYQQTFGVRLLRLFPRSDNKTFARNQKAITSTSQRNRPRVKQLHQTTPKPAHINNRNANYDGKAKKTTNYKEKSPIPKEDINNTTISVNKHKEKFSTKPNQGLHSDVMKFKPIGTTNKPKVKVKIDESKLKIAEPQIVPHRIEDLFQLYLLPNVWFVTIPTELVTTEGYSRDNALVIINGSVYNITRLLTIYESPSREGGGGTEFRRLSKGAYNSLAAPWGVDKTKLFALNATDQDYIVLMDYFIGVIDRRNSINCLVSSYILIGSTALLLAAISIKFLAALQLSPKRDPEWPDRYVLILIPCYTEGEGSLRKTIDSVVQLEYDDGRKFMVIVCDGVVVGKGNDRPTPQIVLDILGHEVNVDEEACHKEDQCEYEYDSVGEGEDDVRNRARIYSGWYECLGKRIPYMVIVKVGMYGEQRKRGNRGKRDSQLIIFRFLSHLHKGYLRKTSYGEYCDISDDCANSSVMEYESEEKVERRYENQDKAIIGTERAVELYNEIYRQVRQTTRVNPRKYEYLMMIDADTQVSSDALTRMISCCIHDTRIMGICGETRISNERSTWITMIQVYEYYISHHLSKSFESLFGSVTCLPGCFSVYRIWAPCSNDGVNLAREHRQKGRQFLLIDDKIIVEYGQCNLDTLHKKNLLSLGEDRYLTTLLLKRFPRHRTKFTGDAHCQTVVPDRWSVFLSQRRRWINSTVHNLVELIGVGSLCGCCGCFSMRTIVLIDLMAALVMPATVAYLMYLIWAAVVWSRVPIISLILLVTVFGMQVCIFLVKRQWQHLGWLAIHLIALPITGFFVPLYAFWHFDDFTWGNTRKLSHKPLKS